MELLAGNLSRSLARIQMRAYQGVMERNQIILSGALRQNMHKELGQLEAKYDGRKLQTLEQEIGRLSTQKEALVRSSERIDDVWDRMQNAREALLNMRDELVNKVTPSPEAFDTYLDTLNDAAGSAVLRKDNLVGNTGQGSWTQRMEVVDTGVLSTTVETNFIGADHVITLDGGEVLTPNYLNKTLSGGGLAFEWANLSVVSRSGDSITFEDTTNPGVEYSGTVRSGGLGIEPSWMYNNFAATADKDLAVADIDAAMKRLLTIEREYRTNDAVLQAAAGKLNNEMDQMQGEYHRILEEESTAKTAERDAIFARVSLAEQVFALTSNTGAAFIESTFLSEPPWAKQRSTLDIVNDVQEF